MHRVIVLDNIAAEGVELLNNEDSIEVVEQPGLSGVELHDALLKADGAILRSGATITADSLEGNSRLRAIVRAGVGTDNIDKVAATRQGVVVMNTPAGNTLSTAEHTFALILALSRNLAPAYQSLMEGRWDRKAYTGAQLAGKTLGVIGLGRIGREVAQRASAFEMHVLGYDPFLPAEQAKKAGIEPCESIDQILPQIDYLTVHTPLTPETTNLIGAREIDMMRPGTRLINVARGGIYDEEALLKGLQDGKLAGVALDVYRQEPCTDSPLFGVPGVLCTPHLGASTEEAQTQVAIEAVHLLIDFLNSGQIRHAVNMVAVDAQTLVDLRGHLDLAYRLGLLLAQWHRGSAASCQLKFRGEVTQQDTRLLTTAFCAGLLEKALDQDVNIVNAEMLLRDRGIQLIQQNQSEPGAFSSSITATVECDGTSFTAGGTLFGNNMPRLIRLNEYRLEAYLDGTMLIFSHNDVPGIIGSVGTIFGKHQVNIAQMSVGRSGDRPGGEAVGVLNLDGPPPEDALEEVLSHPDICSLNVIAMPAAGQLPGWFPTTP